jgi:hypothetical protein
MQTATTPQPATQADDLSNIRGDVRLEIIHEDGTVEIRELKNLIVTTGREALARLLGGARSAGAATQFGVGTGAAAAALGDTNLTGVFRKAVGAATYPALNQVEIPWTLAPADAVGMVIKEYGLFFADNTLFSRIVEAGTITKSAGMTINGLWRITF